MSKVIRLVDRTRTVADWKCPRARYWGYEHNGRGLSKATTSIELFMGITVHDSLAAIATLTKEGLEVSIDEIAQAAYAQLFDSLLKGLDPPNAEAIEYAKEQATLTEGMIRGFYKHVWPKLMAQYPTIVAIESEMEYELLDTEELQIIFMTKPDLVMADAEGELIYIEYKTTSSKQDKWINSWDTAVQLHSSVKATGLTLGKEPSAVQIVGLYKGWESYGKQSSPFCYAYKRNGNPPFTQDQIEYSYKAGFRRYATWELEGGVKAWIESMPDDILASQFPMTPKIFINDTLVEDFFTQRLNRERKVEYAAGLLSEQLGEADRKAILDDYFPQRFDQCQPSFGYSCEFKKLCHGFVQDPLTEGFVEREPHHLKERVQLGLPCE